MTTIPETVARVLDLDAQGTPNPELTAYYRTAAPALAREVERLEKMLDVCGDVHAHNVKLVADRNTARALIESRRQLDAATARAERAEQALAEARAIPALRVDGRITAGALSDKFNEYRLNGATTERARVVEAIAADATKQATDHRCGNPGSEWNQHAADALYEYAVYIRSHNWAPPEEDGNE